MKKYHTEEEKKAAKKAAYKKWLESHKEQERERAKRRHVEEKDKISEYNKKYRAEHKDYFREYMKNWEREHKEERKQYAKARDNSIANNKRRATISKRANALSQDYRYSDIARGFNTDNNVEGQWIEENIFPAGCIYCGDKDWKHLGCDRIDNSIPHTQENCVCSCGICNVERQGRKMSVSEFVEYRKAHPIGCETTNNLKPKVVEINGVKVLKKR